MLLAWRMDMEDSLFMCLASLLERLLRDKLVKEIPFQGHGPFLVVVPQLLASFFALGIYRFL